ncbi:hypothetical protein EVAR_34800_1 [Eumeta japonica]|uniref:Tc1-like transposase DDE domain-containing protein n=1 Tax=Eumeta variegata TaxID=151549 RepID=A0A4C1WDS9_EUMVA|nr:hypothetical protein EVAR_34800_1 [Eumeta japonica]
MPKGKVLKGQAREFVLRLGEYFEKESRNGGLLIPATQVRDRVAAALDETWLNTNHTLSETLTDNTVGSTSAVPMGKRERLIICHAGTVKGFVPGALLAFKSLKTRDYYEMNSAVYEKWFRGMLTSFEEPSIIFIDNAPYHSRQINKMPTQANRRHEIINRFRDNGEEVDKPLLKVELLKILKTKKQPKR